MDTLHEDISAFMIISRWILLRMRNVLDKSCRENQNTNLMINIFFNHATYEIVWKNLVRLGSPKMLL